MLKIGIDASRNRSGGAKAHIIGILDALNELPEGVVEIHVWSYKGLIDQIRDCSWIKKHTHPDLEKNLLYQLLWQRNKLHKEARENNIDIMLNTDASSISRFSPSVTMSRDMLSYEKGEMQRFGFSLQRLRLLTLKYVQNYSLKNSTAAIFLTKYASDVIQQSSGKIKNFAIIPHGVSDNFRLQYKVWNNEDKGDEMINCVYVSNVDLYKHQTNVAQAIKIVRNRGYNIGITFVGGGAGPAQRELDTFMKEDKVHQTYIKQLDFVKHKDLPSVISNADLFVFASSCENMPNTLIEGMCSGLPIVCSNRGPMPEILQDGGSYFDPENIADIANAIEKNIINEDLRKEKTKVSLDLSKQYSWKRCSKETFEFLVKTYNTI